MDTCRICAVTDNHPSFMAKNMKGKSEKPFTYFQCNACGCLQIKEIPDNLSYYYQNDYYSFSEVSDRKLFDNWFKGRLRGLSASLGTARGLLGSVLRTVFSFPQHHEWFRIAGVNASSRILDAGCGSGSLLMRVWKEGFTGAMGADPFIPKDIRYKNGLVIQKSSVSEIKEDSSFDLIMMNHSFEHIPDQMGALAEVMRLLKPSGVAMIRLPLSSSVAWERYRTDWVFLAPPEHLYLHSEESMRLLAEKAGFGIEAVVYDSLGLQFWGSELVKLGIPLQEHRDAMRRFSKKQMKVWEDEAKKANAERTGDMACFFLKKPDGLKKAKHAAEWKRKTGT